MHRAWRSIAFMVSEKKPKEGALHSLPVKLISSLFTHIINSYYYQDITSPMSSLNISIDTSVNGDGSVSTPPFEFPCHRRRYIEHLYRIAVSWLEKVTEQCLCLVRDTCVQRAGRWKDITQQESQSRPMRCRTSLICLISGKLFTPRVLYSSWHH